ncbi:MULTISPECIES: transcriptional repressor LexA [Anaerostipes]|uniref:LexA repressor n=2 Tax=Anaerostipes TaxID=207244 RepID=A0A916VCC3_9FIRM|nr:MULTISPECIES: transcriptional repressor LexA [Anaerostipes]GFO83933.1 LexA repressor [Anaerostipes butyraticus]HJC49846.1 transcriptional repressor LexA [Candidatus Anaerostipes avistercoris]HJC83342.1 transcriptional repressor LexA [Candidatus Anaerostipes avicola]
MPREQLTDKQQQILEFIKHRILEKGYPPAVREICQAVHLRSTSSVHSHLETLERKGYIRRDPTKPRAIEIIDDDFNLARREIVHIPIVGTITAGEPILAVENIEDYFPMQPDFISSRDTFMLHVRGESMINAGIMDGDLVIVQQQPTADNGDIVVAMIDDSATVKRFYKEDGHYRLQPENDAMDPIIVPEVSVIGKVIGLYRSMK